MKPSIVPRIECLPHGLGAMRSGKDPVLPPGPPLSRNHFKHMI